MWVCTLFFFFFFNNETLRAPDQTGEGERADTKGTILVAPETPVDSVFRDSHKATRGSREQLGAGRGKVWGEREVGEARSWFSCVGLMFPASVWFTSGSPFTPGAESRW